MAEAALKAQRNPAGMPEPVARAEVDAVNRREQRSLYEKRRKIYPRLARGAFRRLKWLVMALTLAVYYLSPWLRWERGPNAPDQAILIDFPGRRFYFFFIEIWPQEVYYLTGLLILAAIGLFLVTSVAGRVWCGYTCPQTVWTDLFIAIERLIEGDRSARIRLDRAPWSAAKLLRKACKHLLWLAVAVATGGAWVFYFADAPTLAVDLIHFQAPAVSYLFIGIMTFTTYTLGGIAREQVCIYMCPWPRIQAAMLDEDTLTVTYRRDRGEPRGPYRRGDSWHGRGNCIDCNQCVAVCPMGIDIRDGLQLECISCALCIDACDGVMDRIGLPRGLIAYDTDDNIERRQRGQAPRFRPIRPRTLAYAGIIAVVGIVMLAALLTRDSVDLNVLRDRNPLFTRLADGSIRNGYTVKILNKRHDESVFDLGVEGLQPSDIKLIGAEPDGIRVAPDSLKSFRVLLTVPAASAPAENAPIRFVLREGASGIVAGHASQFLGPKS